MLNFHITSDNLEEVIANIDGSGVYTFQSKKKKYLYIGKSLKIKARLAQHKNWIKDLIKNHKMEYLTIIHCDVETADKLEHEAILYHNPIFNVRHKDKSNYVEMKVQIPPHLAFKIYELNLTQQTPSISLFAEESFIEAIKKYEKRRKKKHAHKVI